MKHWQPEDIDIPSRAARARRALPRGWRKAALQGPLPAGAKAGLVLLGAACLLLGFGLYQAFGPLQPVAPEAKLRDAD